MVMQLPMPMEPADQIALIDAIVAERTREPNKSFFRSIAREWKERVDEYLLHRGSPAHVNPWPAIMSQASSFKNLYIHPADDSVQAEIIENLRDHERDICPHCGSPNLSETLDHYLPKSKYPHLAITPANMIPMCEPCQRRKGEKVGDATAVRFFIHPYFDRFSNEQILQLTIYGPFDRPSFLLDPHKDLLAHEADLVSTHINELQMRRRYITFFKNEYIRLKRNVTRARSCNLDVVQNIENWQAGHSHLTVNNWHYVFYDAVLKSPGMVDYLIHYPLPPYP